MVIKTIAKHSSRNSSIELLRIICMLFVVAQHVIVFGIKPEWRADGFLGGSDYVLSHALFGLFVTAVDVFVLISGWFAIKWHPRKLVSMWIMVLFWSWIMAALRLSSGGGH